MPKAAVMLKMPKQTRRYKKSKKAKNAKIAKTVKIAGVVKMAEKPEIARIAETPCTAETKTLKILETFKVWNFLGKVDGLSKKTWISFKIVERGKFDVECVSNGFFLKHVFRPIYDVFGEKIKKFETL